MIRKASDAQTEIRENMRGGDGSVTIAHFFTQEEITAKSRLCAKMTLPPNASIGLHEHVNEDEVYIIIGGSGILTEGSTETGVTAGDAILTGNGASHSIRNNGNEDLVIIAVIMCYS